MDYGLLGENVGRIGVILLWFFLVGYSIYKAFKRKEKIWIIVLIINFIAGWILPTFIVAILPIVYLIISRNK